LGFEQLQEFTWRQDADSFVRFHCEQVFVASDDQVGTGNYGALDDHVILRIAANASEIALRFNHDGFAGILCQHRVDPFLPSLELQAESRINLVHDRIANGDTGLAGYGVQGRKRSASEAKRRDPDP
jgi:hypothetical protein